MVGGNKLTFSIVIPAYNETSSIGKVLQQLLSTVSGVEIIVVDDCSTDHTVEVVRGFKEVRVISHQTNNGPIQAIVTGIKAASHDIVVSLDADGQHPTEYLHAIVEPLLSNQADIVLGTRHDLPRLGEKIIAWFSGVNDATTGFRAMRKRDVDLLEDDLAYGGMLLVKARKRKMRILEIPIPVKERLAGFSVHSNLNILKKSLKFALWSIVNR
jgi:polyprenyl-phospho-N-acetylgalactosaminyl synthase